MRMTINLLLSVNMYYITPKKTLFVCHQFVSILHIMSFTSVHTKLYNHVRLRFRALKELVFKPMDNICMYYSPLHSKSLTY